MLGSAVFRTGIAPGGTLAGPWVRNPLWTAARAVPSLDLRFADNKSLTDAVTSQNLVTFTRASSGTYVDSQGVIKTATTNLLLRSEEFDNASWNKGNMTVTANALAAPNGTVTADLIDTATETSGTVPFQAVNVSNSTTYILSVYVKTGSATWIRFRTGLGTGSASLWHDINNGSFSASNATFAGVSAATAGDGWRRVVLTVSYGASDGGTRNISITPTSSNGGTAPFGTVYLWGAQLEQSSTVGEYIPTTSTINSAPRFDHNSTTGESLGLLVEEQRTNNVLQSEDFATTWSLNNISVSSNTVVAPDGTTTADTISPPTDGLTTTRFLRQNPALTTQQAYTLSVFVKVGTATANGIALYVSDSTATNNFRANFNLFNLITSPAGTGWATPTATIVPYSGGWYRCILSGVTSTAHASLRTNIYLSTFGNVADNYGSIHVWGAQLEAGSFPTSYIPTTTATATRSADVASITGTNFSSWYRQDEGTVFEDYLERAFNQTHQVVSASNGTASERISMAINSSNILDIGVISGSVDTFAGNTPTLTAQAYRIGFAYKSDSSGVSANGSAVTDDSAVILPTVSQLDIGARAGTNQVLNSTIRRLTFWPQRLPNNVLQSITQ